MASLIDAVKGHPRTTIAARRLTRRTAAKRKSRRNAMGGLHSILSSFFFLAVLTQPSVAQRFPAKPITMVVPYAPGGNVDVTARVLQAAIGDALGQPVVIENRPGGAGLIAGDYVARADPSLPVKSVKELVDYAKNNPN